MTVKLFFLNKLSLNPKTRENVPSMKKKIVKKTKKFQTLNAFIAKNVKRN